MTKYTIKYTTQFKKDYKLAKRQNKDTNLLQSVVALLANGHPLPERFRDHPSWRKLEMLPGVPHRARLVINLSV